MTPLTKVLDDQANTGSNVAERLLALRKALRVRLLEEYQRAVEAQQKAAKETREVEAKLRTAVE